MERFPDEVLLHIFSFLEPQAIARFQLVCRKFLILGRDNRLWKQTCFDLSRVEALRLRRERLAAQNAPLVSLRQALEASTVTSSPTHDQQTRPSTTPDHERRRTRALANWDPSTLKFQPDWYDEYIQRHEKITLSWFPSLSSTGTSSLPEAQGLALVRDHAGTYTHVVSPLDDGTVAIWDPQGAPLARTAPLSAPTVAEPSATENISIDSASGRAYIAAATDLVELDLATLKPIRTTSYPFPITTLSPTSPSLILGTTQTLHQHDPRSSTRTHALLSEPGPLSIQPTSAHELAVAGRFTSLLFYDRRAWPRVRATTFSGARLSALALLPQAFVPRSLDLVADPALPVSALLAARNAPGSTLVAAGTYKGKGSLELHALAPSRGAFKNRQTASRARLLDLAVHGARLAYSDGDGCVKWVERDGAGAVREFNINDADDATGGENGVLGREQEGMAAREEGIFARDTGDIVRKICTTRRDAGELVLWSGEGRVGLLQFGSGMHGTAIQQEEQEHVHEEAREYERRMRRALEGAADEARFVQGLGMPYAF